MPPLHPPQPTLPPSVRRSVSVETISSIQSRGTSEHLSITSESPSNAPGRSWIKNLVLTHEDKDVLEKGKRLSDAHIHAVNRLLRKQYPAQNGLQSTLHLQAKLQWSSNSDDFIQIINVSGQHRVCASNVLCSPGIVEVYDSVPSYSIES